MRIRIITSLVLATALGTGLAACKRKDETPPPPPESSQVDSGTAPAEAMPPPADTAPPPAMGDAGSGDTTMAAGDTDRTAGTVVDDAAITAKVKTALAADQSVAARNIDVDTRSGTVTLTGQVDSQAEVDRALEIARGTEGVGTVDNQLSVRPK